MINYKNNKGAVELEVKGNLPEIMSDIVTLIHSIYESTDEKHSEIFKEYFMKNVGVAFLSAEELDKLNEEKAKKIEKKKGSIDELIEHLENLVKLIDEIDEDENGSDSDED